MNVAPRFLGIDEVLELHGQLVQRFGGSPGLRDLGMLESAVAMPQAGFGDSYLHDDIFEMAAAYLFHIVMNHPFIDGNKRTGTHAALVFLADNGYAVELSQMRSTTSSSASARARSPRSNSPLRSATTRRHSRSRCYSQPSPRSVPRW